MYNFLRIRITSMQYGRVMSTRSSMNFSMQLCSFCNFYHLTSPKPVRNILLRHYATTDSIEIFAPKKKRKIKWRFKKYVELLEVTDQATNNRKAAVHKLNSTHVSFLINQPDITLDKLHKIAKIHQKSIITQVEDITTGSEKNFEDKQDNVHSNTLEKSYEELEDELVVLEDLKESNMSNDNILIKDALFPKMIVKDDNKEIPEDILSKTSKYKTLNSNVLIPFMKEKDRFENFLTDQNLVSQLWAYADAYIQNKMWDKVLRLLKFHKNKLKHSEVSTIMLYNLLLQNYVSKAHLGKALEIYRMIKEHSVQPNTRTYALMFEIIARMKNNEKQAERMAEIFADMNDKDISIDEVMNTVQMNATQRDTILQCIRVINPQYRIQYKDVDTNYNCELLRHLMVNSNFQSPAKELITMDELQDMVRMQIDMEKQYELEVKNIVPFNGDLNDNQRAIKRIAELKTSWKSVVTKGFEESLNNLKQKEMRLKYDLKILYPFLQLLPKEEYINAILREINQLAKFSDTYSTSMFNLYIMLGKYIYKKYELQRQINDGFIENIIQIYNKYLEWYLQTNPADRNVNARVKWQQLVQEASRSGICCETTVSEWPNNVLMNIGKFLYNIIMNYVKIPKSDTSKKQEPAFYFIFRTNSKNYLSEEIKPKAYLRKLYKDVHLETLTFQTILLPTCSPPRPWIDIDNGGYLFSKVMFMRDSYMIPTHLLRNTPNEQLYPAIDCLNQLGTIPWRINKPILDILIQIFREGGSEDLNIPLLPSTLSSLTELIANNPEAKSDTTEDKNTKSKIAFQLKRKKAEMLSMWCDCLYKLSLANHFRDKVFWFPHNMDFRGRVYPVPPHLTHLSSDLSRSILLFAQGKPLGSNGLDWLKIHAINLTGMKKKESIQKRLEFANEVLDLIIDSARNPLTGKMWWAKSDEPWQTLAVCKEIDNALQSPDVEKYVCRFPVHQDGTCNGLQHYAALGRDLIGAESVNLYPSDTPQDVYSVVAGMINERRRADAEAGNSIAKALEGHVSRKVIKQTVMTTVYGVTKIGARIQISRQLSDLKGFNHNYMWNGSMYLVEKTFESLRTMFTSAKEIQDWLTECARVIATRYSQYVQWETPLGLPVIQPYNKCVKSKQKKIIRVPDTIKQRNAFPPNFIHSLDSTHMMLTSLHCEQAGITFMSVHDCFWTHPCTVHIMNRICREQFIALHNEPILKDLSAAFLKKYEQFYAMSSARQRDDDVSLKLFKQLPKRGDFDINEVLRSRYFFS